MRAGTGMFRDEPGWPPTPVEAGDVWAEFGAHTTASGALRVGWTGGARTALRTAVRVFLEAELAYHRGDGADASYIRLIADRPPRPGDDLSVLASNSPFAVFEFGLYPMAPAGWPVVLLDDLIVAALAHIDSEG